MDGVATPKEWCRAMSHYAVRGDGTYLSQLVSNAAVLKHFQTKYAVFFEEDLRWTAANARHLNQHIPREWIHLFQKFEAAFPDLHLTTTAKYVNAWSTDDAQLVDNIFETLWNIHWSTDSLVSTTRTPETRKMLRWWLGQLSLTYTMDDLPLSACVRQHVVSTCLNPGSTAIELNDLISLWHNYIDALEGLSRLSPNDCTVAKKFQPVVPPFYVSYDQDPSTYQGIANAWANAREL
jgi:hypothetical protein